MQELEFGSLCLQFRLKKEDEFEDIIVNKMNNSIVLMVSKEDQIGIKFKYNNLFN